MKISISHSKNIPQGKIIALYQANKWSSAQKPQLLYQGLLHSHSLITAWDDEELVGLGNAISDGFLVVYYPHLLVHPDYQGKGIGRMIMNAFQERYGDFHQQILVSESHAISFYEKCGFVKGADTQSMWIYQGDDH